jgi:PadR family transcriptional regulator, regulatory protein PadR
MARAREPRMTLPTQVVLKVLLRDPSKPMYGLMIGEAAGLASGTVHPILARLERLGWLESSWEEANPSESGRPRRRYYNLTTDGAEMARNAIVRASARTGGRSSHAVLPGFAEG